MAFLYTESRRLAILLLLKLSFLIIFFIWGGCPPISTEAGARAVYLVTNLSLNCKDPPRNSMWGSSEVPKVEMPEAVYNFSNSFEFFSSMRKSITEIELPTFGGVFDAKSIEEFLANPVAIGVMIFVVWIVLVLLSVNFMKSRKEARPIGSGNDHKDESADDRRRTTTAVNRREKDEFVRIFESRIAALKESERRVDERINKLEEMLNENNGYQLWSNVLPVALSVFAVIMSLRRGR